MEKSGSLQTYPEGRSSQVSFDCSSDLSHGGPAVRKVSVSFDSGNAEVAEVADWDGFHEYETFHE
jgi:hypothetical protein